MKATIVKWLAGELVVWCRPYGLVSLMMVLFRTIGIAGECIIPTLEQCSLSTKPSQIAVEFFEFLQTKTDCSEIPSKSSADNLAESVPSNLVE